MSVKLLLKVPLSTKTKKSQTAAIRILIEDGWFIATNDVAGICLSRQWAENEGADLDEEIKTTENGAFGVEEKKSDPLGAKRDIKILEETEKLMGGGDVQEEKPPKKEKVKLTPEEKKAKQAAYMRKWYRLKHPEAGTRRATKAFGPREPAEYKPRALPGSTDPVIIVVDCENPNCGIVNHKMIPQSPWIDPETNVRCCTRLCLENYQQDNDKGE